jgi:opacity protein-like surface antigen
MKTSYISLVALALLALAPDVKAHGEALYLAVDLGSARQKANSFSESDSSAAMTLGYEITANWSLNLSYTDVGEVFTGFGTLVTEDEFLTSEHFMKAKALGLTAQYLSDPLFAGWALGARLGLMHFDHKLITVVPDLADDFSYTRLDSSTAPTVGVMASYKLTDKLDMTVSADYMAPDVQYYGNSTVKVKTSRFAVGLKYNF